MHELIFFSHSQDLKDYMRQAGEVTYADAHKPRRNEGCVEFASERVRIFYVFKNYIYFLYNFLKILFSFFSRYF